MTDVDRLRDEIRRRRRAVTDKIGRQRRINGANITGSEFDPRRAPDAIDRYNGPQLRRYLDQLNNFMDRRNQFVGGAQGAPLPRNMVRAYQAKVNRFQTAAEQHISEIAGIEITPLGRTVEEFRAGRQLNVRNAVVNTPYGNIVKDIKGVPSAGALAKLMKDVDSKLESSYLPGKIKEGRESLSKALNMMGESNLVDDVDSLSDYQFNALWFGTPFAETAFMTYDIVQDRAAGTRKERWQDKVVDNAYKLISEFLEWASDLEEPGKS